MPTDCSDHSRIGIKYALELASQGSAEVKLLYILEYSNYPEENSSEKDAGRKWKEKAQDKLEQFWRSFSSRRICELEVREGDVVSEVINVAKLEGIDLIVMSSHGYKGLMYSMKGSSTEKITRYAPCPVLCVKNGGHQFIH